MNTDELEPCIPVDGMMLSRKEVKFQDGESGFVEYDKAMEIIKEARATNLRLHRRTQEAESGALKNAELKKLRERMRMYDSFYRLVCRENVHFTTKADFYHEKADVNREFMKVYKVIMLLSCGVALYIIADTLLGWIA